jgi:hypothetical protein
MLRIQINASRHPRERPGRPENGFQEKLRLSAQILRTVLFYTAWALND